MGKNIHIGCSNQTKILHDKDYSHIQRIQLKYIPYIIWMEVKIQPKKNIVMRRKIDISHQVQTAELSRK